MSYNDSALYISKLYIKTIYFTTSSFPYVYDHQVNKDVTNISCRYFRDLVNLLNN